MALDARLTVTVQLPAGHARLGLRVVRIDGRTDPDDGRFLVGCSVESAATADRRRFFEALLAHAYRTGQGNQPVPAGGRIGPGAPREAA